MQSTLVLSLIVVMFCFAQNPFEPSWLLIIIGSVGLLNKNLRNHKYFWLTIFLVCAVDLAFNWLVFSRSFLIAYWVLAIFLAMHNADEHARIDTLKRSAQYLLGTAMLIASVHKIISTDFLDGSFLQSWFLLWPNNMDVARSFLGFNIKDYSTNQRILHAVLNTDAITRLAFTAYDPSRLENLCRWFSQAGAALELSIGMLFLLPTQNEFVHKARHALLILFLLTCYLVLPVFTFAAVLIALGYAQCNAKDFWLKRFYRALIPIIAMYTMMPKIGGWWKMHQFFTSLLS